MQSFPAIIAIGIAIGFVAGFFGNFLMQNQATDMLTDELALEKAKNEQLKKALGTAIENLNATNTNLSTLQSNMEILQANNKQLRKVNQQLTDTINELESTNGSDSRAVRSLMLLEKLTEPIDDETFSEWRSAVLNETANLDAKLLDPVLDFIDLRSEILQLEAEEPAVNASEWNSWNQKVSEKRLEYVEAYNRIVSVLAQL
jgi:chromosome segregation ATPase